MNVYYLSIAFIHKVLSYSIYICHQKWSNSCPTNRADESNTICIIRQSERSAICSFHCLLSSTMFAHYYSRVAGSQHTNATWHHAIYATKSSRYSRMMRCLSWNHSWKVSLLARPNFAKAISSQYPCCKQWPLEYKAPSASLEAQSRKRKDYAATIKADQSLYRTVMCFLKETAWTMRNEETWMMNCAAWMLWRALPDAVLPPRVSPKLHLPCCLSVFSSIASCLRISKVCPSGTS